MSLHTLARYIVLVALLYNVYGCTEDVFGGKERTSDIVVDGITLVAPPRPFKGNPVADIKKLGAEWVAIIPYGFTPDDEPVVYFNQSRQWWGETREGIIETVRHCHSAGLKVMLKPQIWAHRKWSGDISYDNVVDWRSWEADYENYLSFMTSIADSLQVEMLCVGTELKQSVAQRPLFWENLIKKLRNLYRGKLTYASNWDEYQGVPFWSLLDYIGINAYFPLTDKRVPREKDLVDAWKPIAESMKKISSQEGKPILFTEFGYLSTDYNTHNTWEKEESIHDLQVNEDAQATALDILFQCFYPQNWWAGGFLWKWYPQDYHVRNKEKDYTVQGKKAQKILHKWYNK